MIISRKEETGVIIMFLRI